MKLFEITITPIPTRKEKCQDCKHSQRWQCNSKVFWYCGIRKSKRTANGLLKIKARQSACDNFQEDI